MGYNRNEEYLLAFGKHFKELRLKKGISQENLALEADVDYQIIYRIEKGINNPTISTLYALSKPLGIHPQDFLNFDFNQA
jgi:transcriptional regulator with XRE-family HTH domain